MSGTSIHYVSDRDAEEQHLWAFAGQDVLKDTRCTIDLYLPHFDDLKEEIGSLLEGDMSYYVETLDWAYDKIKDDAKEILNARNLIARYSGKPLRVITTMEMPSPIIP